MIKYLCDVDCVLIEWWYLLVDRDMIGVQLQQQAGRSADITIRIRKNAYISLESVEKICKALDCNIDDIVEFSLDDTEEKKNDA